jgi:adenylate cyclase
MRVTRCFAFLDLCGFTAYTNEHGDGQAVAALAQLRATLRAEAERHGVRVTKWLGDGAMLSGIDTTSVIRCTARVRDIVSHGGPMALRAGICEGPVIMFEGDDYIGAAVNWAARLCDAAEAHQVLIDGGTAARVPAELELRALPAVSLDGLTTETVPHEILRRTSLATEG